MLISGWGRYPKISSNIQEHWSINQVQSYIKQSDEIIPFGLLRSYGDSALNSTMLSALSLNKILDFSFEHKTITCESGISFKELINFLTKFGLNVPVTPGTKFVTVGGAIASDIHGKNHHIHGTFGSFVESLRLMIADGSIINCSKTENTDLFYATIGGMGLTGLIIDATFKLVELKSAIIEQTSIQAKDLKHLLELFEQNKESTYTVSWLDTNITSRKFGRGVLFVGKETDEKRELVLNDPKINLPCNFPSNTLNKSTITLLNNLYYFFNKSGVKQVSFDKFFYPLDVINNWNRGYGRSGFIQYQFVIPKENSYKVLSKVLNIIADYRQSSFLTVLKLMGKANDYLLSFPLEGFTLAMDIPVSSKSLDLANKLDEVIIEYGGRLYLTKDARMTKEVFIKSYSNIEKFIEIKAKFDPNNKFQSLQSKRLGIRL